MPGVFPAELLQLNLWPTLHQQETSSVFKALRRYLLHTPYDEYHDLLHYTYCHLNPTNKLD